MRNRSLEEIKRSQEVKKKAVQILIFLGAGIVIGIMHLIFTGQFLKSLGFTAVVFLVGVTYTFVGELLKKSKRIRKMEDSFPDFIELMASNLRAGMTVDKALLLSSRKEFSPLDEEILLLGKDIVTGKEISVALIEMASRTQSEKIKKTVEVIISGIRSGGDLAVLLEETAMNMRERGFVEKRAASNVLMYLIFIFFAIGAGAPALFSLSSVLVQILGSILSGLPEIEATNMNLPFALSSVNVSVAFVTYFSIAFLIAIDVLASLLLGLVTKGEEREGTKYILPLISTSISVYFIIRFTLQSYFADLFA